MNDNGYTSLPGWRGGDANAAYLDKNLKHVPVETSLDDSVSWRQLLQLLVYAVLASFLVFLPLIFFGLILLVGGSGEGFAVMAGLAYIVSGIAFWVTLLGMRLVEPIAEWRVLLADRRGSLDSAYSSIRGTLARRSVPVDHAVRIVPTGLGRDQVRNRLVLSEGQCQAYVSVFSYGTNLYLGWQMWRSRRGYALIGQFVSDLLASIMGRLSPERIMMRTEGVRAMREAVHAACREGLATAVDQVAVPVSYGFPEGLPAVQNDRAKSAPTPGLQPTPAWGPPGGPPPASGPHAGGTQTGS
ncbi:MULTISPECIES: hypothetical protein [Streptomyces]|uniref:Adhesin n=1 Tax=Streptomyces koelreuteriae TaxID=2838015 RepID=A0ABX8FN48_9ACTN|nr:MULTISPECIES: hypothetical protein [Streptomyces]QWB22580.1 hypothetical protein KJK29_08300 [Streptomyces koelreuteriae]UUA05529.1 hypothetical protein NNW98_08340 [Streptomyces koelreuteriae]UUA13156.1 hypothetical protein NNW99_08340 [Streptomyces sp. CRCS-T-1]